MDMSGKLGTRRGLAAAGGFTLIELMIVVLVVAILAAVAVASYDFATVKARRNLAAGCVLENAQLMERFYTVGTGGVVLTYVGAPALSGACVDELEGVYTFAFNPATTRTTFRIVATPVGRQLAKDKLCGTLSVDQTGLKTESGSGTVQDCW